MRWLVLAAMCVCSTALQAAEKQGEVIRLWPEGSIEIPENAGPEKTTVAPKDDGTIIKLSNVTDPTLAVYKPKGTNTGAAVIICPGGGYGILAYDLEGTEVAEWLNALGATGIVLKYRVPRQRDAAFQDAQRAVSLVRSRAAEWGIDPKRIGILGFSAGGHLAARVSTNYKERAYKPVDAADQASCRPDFTILIYPAYLSNAEATGLDEAGLPVTAETPTTFIAVASGDKFTIDALYYMLALKKAKVSAELHVFALGGHGCGLRQTDATVTTWPGHCARWLRDLKILPGAI
ncbi:MAG TPA: alpha/beta hydrolase [Phycisphaerae bacterium]|nr:alpha/beta hydrolase [Phycisphaerae bacterium]